MRRAAIAVVLVSVALPPAGPAAFENHSGLPVGQASGRFAAPEQASPADGRFAARAMARAVLIDAALGAPDANSRDPLSGNPAAAMARLSRAIPVGEVWRSGSASSSSTAAVEILEARVAPIGGPRAPALSAGLMQSDLLAGDWLAVQLRVRGRPAYVALFAWQADDTVVILSPTHSATDSRAHRIEPGRRSVLPKPGGPVLAARPMPGSRESLEAVLVLAGTDPFDVRDLAVSAVALPGGAGATPMSVFLDGLARLDLSRITLAVLPYRVRVGEVETAHTLILQEFPSAISQTILDVMVSGFAGYRRHRALPGPAGERRYAYVSVAPTGQLERWLRLLLADLRLVPGRDVVLTRESGAFILKLRPGPGPDLTAEPG